MIVNPGAKNSLPSEMDVPCRFGCDGATGIYYLPKGCRCWPDRVQALCEQHAEKASPMEGMFLIARPAGVRPR